jgi:nitroreductase
MDAIECLKTRRSIRVYKERPIAPEILEDIVDCARLAATAMNVQPWSFVLVTDPAVRQKIVDTLGHAEFLRQAPVTVAVFARRTDFYVEDASAATMNLLNAAHAHGLGSCWVAAERMDYAPRVAEILGAPAEQALFALVALGYPDEKPQPEKRPLSDVLRRDGF